MLHQVNQCDKGYSLFSSTPAWCITGDTNQTTGKQVDWKAPEPKNVQPPLQVTIFPKADLFLCSFL